MASKTSLPFLRPFSSARLFLLQTHLRRISTSLHLQEQKGIQKEAIPMPETPPTTLPYHVHRTASQQLPVYQLSKRGGNLRQTRIRKIDGDVIKLRNDMQKALGLMEDLIVINPVTRHILIKGWEKTPITKFLEQLGF